MAWIRGRDVLYMCGHYSFVTALVLWADCYIWPVVDGVEAGRLYNVWSLAIPSKSLLRKSNIVRTWTQREQDPIFRKNTSCDRIHGLIHSQE